MADEIVRKLVDRSDIMEDLLEVVTPKYFPKHTLDKHRVGMFGWLVEATAKSIEDTITLEQRRSEDYCPELSNSEIHVNQTAKIRGISTVRATPAHCFAVLGILKSDILKRGVTTANETKFIIDRRSIITYNDVNFSLEDDIIIRAVFRNGKYIYTANYSGEHSTYESYIQMFEQTTAAGEEILAMICQIYQFKYNITDKIVTDDIEFMYDGLYYDYENKLAGFEVYYKQSYTSEYKQAKLAHYLSDTTEKCLFYNDDETGILRILNNPVLNIGTNASIRVEIKETMGTEGSITMGSSRVGTFLLYSDSAYNYSGVNVAVNILSDTSLASDGDTLEDLKKRMIDAKSRRNNITTEHDIISYINDVDANVQIVKKRNDIQDRSYYMYTLMRYGDNNAIAPATTKKLFLRGIQSMATLDYGDFDYYVPTVDRKILRAYNRFILHTQPGEPDQDYVTKVPKNAKLKNLKAGEYYLTSPYMILVDDRNIAHYYFTSVDEEVVLNMKNAATEFPFQMICRSIKMYRNAHDAPNSDTYRFDITGTMNTANDSLLVDEEGNVIDDTAVMCHIFFNVDGNPAAYIPLKIAGYNQQTREFSFTGTIKTNDYITEFDKLEITNGLYQVHTDKTYGSVIDYKNAQLQVSFMYKYNDTAGDYTKTDDVYNLLPAKYTNGYIHMDSYINGTNNPYNMILEFGKFTRSPVVIEPSEEHPTVNDYFITEVPFFEYEFGLEYTASLYPKFKDLLNTYGNLLKLTTDFEVSLKFIATYGASKYITVTGGRDNKGAEVVVNLADLNPTLYFKIYGINAPIDDIRNFIYEYMRDTYIIGTSVYISNICTEIEQRFSAVKSIKYMGVNKLDASYQEFTYNTPVFDNSDIITRYIPEQFNITDIQIELDET